MSYIYKFARHPGSRDLERRVEAAAASIADKLDRLDIGPLDVSDYTKKYFTTQRGELLSSLNKFTYILLWSLRKDVPLEKQSIMEYGGGPGILSLFAREMGIGTVLYTDIYDVSCRDAGVIGEHLGLKADAYILGDIDEVIEYVQSHGLDCAAVMSNDVIEHIYDMDSYLRKVPRLSGNGLTVAMLTTANMLNFRNVGKVMEKQRIREHQGNREGFGHKQRDATEAYFDIRKRIVGEYAPGLSGDEIEQLARNTRGMMIDNIRAAVDRYRDSGEMPGEMAHPTNTCDPYTGNWCEHLMDPFELRDVMEECGFRARILPGYYYTGKQQGVAERLVRSAMNLAIRLGSRLGLRIAPMWMLYAYRP